MVLPATAREIGGRRPRDLCDADVLRARSHLREVLVAEQARIQIKFSRVRWHEFVAAYNCSPEQVKGAYFRLVEVEGSQRLNEFLRGDRAPKRVYRELHHYRFLDESGCHEVFAESWTNA
jgi:hypothetical protein